MLDVIELGLTQKEFEYQGRFFTQPRSAMCLRPVQEPLPEIYVAGIKEHRDIQLRVAIRRPPRLGQEPSLAGSRRGAGDGRCTPGP